jgi:hypothetical protein
MRLILKLSKIRIAVFIISPAGIFACFLLLIPKIRAALIDFAEKNIHYIDKDVWNYQLVSMSLTGLLLIAVVLFTTSQKFVIPKILLKKRAFLYPTAEAACVVFFIFASVFLASLNMSVWVDEVYTFNNVYLTDIYLTGVGGGLRDIISNSAKNSMHPPLYFLILKTFSVFSGNSIFGLKMVSVIPAALTMICTAIFLVKEYSHTHALYFLLAFIASESMMHYGIEIRMYSWALFFVTMAAICAYYIITKNKKIFFAAFLLFAEAAALTHYYAGLAIAIGYSLLLLYLVLHDKKKSLLLLLTGVIAVLPYLLLIPRIMGQIGEITTTSEWWWIKPLTHKDILSFFYTVFAMGNKIMGLVFFIICAALFVYFLAKKNKTEKDSFAIGSLLVIFILGLFGVLFSIIVIPLLVARYLIPCSGLLLIFFAIACGSIKNPRITCFMFAFLLTCASLTFASSVYIEKKENNDFKKFCAYINTNALLSDIFVFPKEWYNPFNKHLLAICKFIFPKYDKADFTNEELESLETSLQYRFPDYKNRGAWIFIHDNEREEQINPEITDHKAKLAGIFGWGFYRFKLYHYTFN